MPPKRPHPDQCCFAKGTALCKCRDKWVDALPVKVHFLLDMKSTSEQGKVLALSACAALSTSQLKIIERARGKEFDTGRITSVMAAAAAGKTKTMLALCAVLVGLGHTHLAYCLFNADAKNDVKRRLDEMGLTGVSVQTMDGMVQANFKSLLANTPVGQLQRLLWDRGMPNTVNLTAIPKAVRHDTDNSPRLLPDAL